MTASVTEPAPELLLACCVCEAVKSLPLRVSDLPRGMAGWSLTRVTKVVVGGVVCEACSLSVTSNQPLPPEPPEETPGVPTPVLCSVCGGDFWFPFPETRETGVCGHCRANDGGSP